MQQTHKKCEPRLLGSWCKREVAVGLLAMQTFLLLLPDFSLILLGAALRRYGGFADGFWSGLEKLVISCCFGLLFSALARATLDFGETAPLVAAGILTMLAGFLLVFGRATVDGAQHRWDSLRGCNAAIASTIYIGFAVAGRVHGLLGLATMGTLCGAMVPLRTSPRWRCLPVTARAGCGASCRETAGAGDLRRSHLQPERIVAAGAGG